MNTQKDNSNRSADARLDERFAREMESLTTNKELLSYTFKKTRRYVSAIHLATRHMGQHEPVGRELRIGTIAVLTAYVTPNDLANARKHMVCVLSLLEVASFSRLISIDNTEVLRREAHLLLELLRQCEHSIDQEHIRTYSDLFGAGAATPITVSRPAKQRISPSQPTDTSSPTDPSRALRPSRGRHADRILQSLPFGQSFSISDIQQLVPDIPPKTLQRELIFLVTKKALNKAGSRRWSTYTRSA
ncbi:MAG: hypothetical protein Q8P93_04735 [bacterium]|nr:hypothetical protein [bacterium]